MKYLIFRENRILMKIRQIDGPVTPGVPISWQSLGIEACQGIPTLVFVAVIISGILDGTNSVAFTGIDAFEVGTSPATRVNP